AVLVCNGQPDGCRCRASTALNAPLPALDIAAGRAQTYLVKKDGTVWVWGKADDLGSPFGPLNPATGNAWERQILAPLQLPDAATPATPAAAIAAGEQGACALLNDGTVTCWGTLDTVSQGPTPVVVAGPLVDGGKPFLRGVVSISRGARHACAV